MSGLGLLPLWAWVVIAGAVLGALVVIPALLAKRNANRREFARKQRHGPSGNSPGAAPMAVPMVSYAEVSSEYLRRLEHWKATGKEFVARRIRIEATNFQDMEVAELLRHASAEELGNLTAILAINSGSEPAAIGNALRKAGSHWVASLARGSDVAYQVVVSDVAIKLGAKNLPKSGTVPELEKLAIGAALEQMLAQATPEQRKAIFDELAKNQKSSSAGLMTATGGLALANLSGFGLYMAASTSLAAITGAVGLTLPFAVYTGMSSVLAAVTGPLGWVALAGAIVFKFGGAEYKKTVPGVIAIASTRLRLMANREDELSKLVKQQYLHDDNGRRLEALAYFIASMERNGKHQKVPRANVPW